MACLGQILNTWGPSIRYIKGSKTRHKGVPTASSRSQPHAGRFGSCVSLVWLWDPGIQLIDRTLYDEQDHGRG